MNPQDLAQLHDIQMPAPIGWWPLAPGWYLLAALMVILILGLYYLLHRVYANGRAKREALRELALYQQEYQQHANSQLISANISALLKRVALVYYYPRTQVAGLHGDAWISFLNNKVKHVNFNPVRTELLELPYQPPHKRNLQPLFKLTRQWIKRQGKPCSN